MQIGVQMKKFLFVFLVSAYSTLANASDMKLCKIVAERLQETLPIQVDRFTKVTNISCVPSSKKVVLAYMHEISAPIDIVKSINFEREIKPSSLNFFCTDPAGQATLSAFDITKRFYTETGVYVGAFFVRKSECR